MSMEAAKHMNVVILKYFQYALLREEAKFTLTAAAAKLNLIADVLHNVPEIAKCCFLLPDSECEELSPFLKDIPAEHILPFSEANACIWARSSEPTLFVDEQAIYLSREFIKSLLKTAGRGAATWEDTNRFLYSYNYLQACDLFIAPANIVFNNLPSVGSFSALKEISLTGLNVQRMPIGISELRFLYGRATVINPLPYHYAIEPTSRCDSQCIMCPFHSPDPEIAKGAVYLGKGGEDMPLEQFKSLVDQIAAQPWTYLPYTRNPMITAQLRGEPLIAPEFREMCRYIKEMGIRLSFTTNGNALDREGMIDFLLDIGLDEIIISLDADREASLHVRPQLNYDAIMNSVRTLYKRRKQRGLKKPTIYTKTVFLRGMPQVDMKKTADVFLKFSDYVGFAYENMADANDGHKKYTGYFFDPGSNHMLPCLSLSDVASTYADGRVPVCFSDPLNFLGNSLSEGISGPLLNSDLRAQLLSQHSSGKITHLACLECTAWYAQFNVTRMEGDYQIQENPILSYWSYATKKQGWWKRLKKHGKDWTRRAKSAWLGR